MDIVFMEITTLLCKLWFLLMDFLHPYGSEARRSGGNVEVIMHVGSQPSCLLGPALAPGCKLDERLV